MAYAVSFSFMSMMNRAEQSDVPQFVEVSRRLCKGKTDLQTDERFRSRRQIIRL